MGQGFFRRRWTGELANVCAVKCLRAPGQRERLLAGLALRARFAIEERPVNHATVLALALDTGLTAYDDSYLWLALEFDAELVTLDEALAQAWASLPKPEGSGPMKGVD